MHFPFYYTGEMVFYKPENFETDSFEQKISYTRNAYKTLFNFPVSVKFKVVDDSTSITIKYRIPLFENNIIFLLALVFTVYFYLFDAGLYSVLSGIIGVSYYVGNILKMSKSIKLELFSIIGKNPDIGEHVLWQKQQEWMKDKTLCSACGEPKNPYSHKCVNCGIYFLKKNKKEGLVNASATRDLKIDYNFHKKNK